MFRRIKQFFAWRRDIEDIKKEILSIHRLLGYLSYRQEKLMPDLEDLRKKSHDDYTNLHDIRNMVGSMRADISSISLELAMKPSVGEQPFVKLSGNDGAWPEKPFEGVN